MPTDHRTELAAIKRFDQLVRYPSGAAVLRRLTSLASTNRAKST